MLTQTMTKSQGTGYGNNACQASTRTLSLTPRTYIRKAGHLPAYNLGAGRQRQVNPQENTGSQTRQHGEFEASEKPCFKKQGE